MDESVPVRAGRLERGDLVVRDARDAQCLVCRPAHVIEVPRRAEFPEEVGAIVHLLRLIAHVGVLAVVRGSESDVAAHDVGVDKAVGDHRAEHETAHRMADDVDRGAFFLLKCLYDARCVRGDLLDRGVYATTEGVISAGRVVAERDHVVCGNVHAAFCHGLDC